MFNPLPTVVREVPLDQPEPAAIGEAAKILQQGGLVAFPTETVYGLGANALDAAAVERIFAAKGRPATNPVIVHVADVAAARQLTTGWPSLADRLAAAFWPGPLTLVLPKSDAIPNSVSAGGPTVGLRIPAHPVALALLKAAQVPVAAPSANRSMQISPTTAQHVLSGLRGRVDLILDAGPTTGGLESTVLDLTVTPPRLLRPGLVTLAQLEAVIGEVASGAVSDTSTPEPLKSPGLLERHYAPKARLVCTPVPADRLVEQTLGQVKKVGWLRLDRKTPSALSGTERVLVVEMPPEASDYSQRLYAVLHELDDAGVDVIVVDRPPETDEWRAVNDRLRRAAAS